MSPSKAHLRQPLQLALVAGDTSSAKRAARELEARYSFVPPAQADVVVVLGGDGTMLHTIHDYLDHPKPIYGMNCGSVGFLLNVYGPDFLPKRIAKARSVTLHPLLMTATTTDGQTTTAHAINDINLWRHSRQAAKLEITIDGVNRIAELICDGLIVCTPAGSTAYNLSAHGPILPLNAQTLALTPVSPFRPRRWRGAILDRDAQITITVREPDKRPVQAAADSFEVNHVAQVVVREDRSVSYTLLFDPDHSLEERILREQFAT